MPDYQHGHYSNGYTVLQSVETNTQSTSIHKNAKTISGSSASNYAFKDCANTIETVTFETDSLLSEIQEYAFYSCSKLREIDLRPCLFLTVISNYAFSSCSSLSSIQLSNSVLTLGDYVFDSSGLTKFTFTSSVTIIPKNCFSYCSRLTTIEIPIDSNITKIMKWILYRSSITTFNIPAKVNFVHHAFIEDSNVQFLSVSPQNQFYKMENLILIDKRNNYAHTCPPKITDEIIIPEGIVGTFSATFSTTMCPSVKLPSTLQLIGEYCFSRSKISNLEIPDSVTTIGKYAFVDCTQLTTVNLPNNIVNLSENALLTVD